MKFLSLFFILALTQTTHTFAKDKNYTSEDQKFSHEVFFTRSDVIWGFDFLSDNRIIFTERGGKMAIFDPITKKVTELSGVPKVHAHGQGGLLDVRVHPKSGLIYFTYSEPIKGDISTTAWAMATLSGDKLISVKKLFSAHQPNDNEIHYGSRIEFDGKGHIFITVGDRNERHHAQELKFHQGKVLRFREDGSVPGDNPFVAVKGARPEIWSYGHRNPQGLVIHPESGQLWEAEFGPRGGDEVNLIIPGKNYGWPVVTFGKEYWGPKIGEGTKKEGMEDPVIHWVPSISPSAMAFYQGETFPKWKGNLFLATLSSTHIHRIVLDGKKVVKEEELLKDLDYRFRNIRSHKDGFLYYSTDEGKLGRIVPVKSL
jgi:glucose/arabinose dehydrogenase